MSWEKGTLTDLMGQRIVYRNLQPVDPGIPGLDTTWQRIGFERYFIPRKTSLEYAQVIWFFLQEAQRLRGETQAIERVLFIGDSARNDGGAARNMGLHRPSRVFIGADDLAQPKQVEVQGDMMVANRWNALGDFMAWLDSLDFVCDAQTALLIDLDKTSLGARGRNDGIIDMARVRAAQRTVEDVLGSDFQEDTFRSLYAQLNQAQYHFLTEDNQDYVAYICLMLAGHVYEPERFWQDMTAQSIKDVRTFCACCNDRVDSMSNGLRRAHQEVCNGIAAGDPTPFKTFRRDEFLETIARMDVLPDEAPAEQVLAEEIVMTAEVRDLAQDLANRGVLVFGLSDKPDEASIPTPEAREQGYRGIHATPMKIYGESIS